MSIHPRELKRAALVGLHYEHQRIDAMIQRLERELGGFGADAPTAEPPRRKRRMSAAGRANIIAALKKRWAAVRKAKAEPKSEPRAAAKPRGAKKAPKPVVAKPAPKKTVARAKGKAAKKSTAKKTAFVTKAKSVPATKKPAAKKRVPTAKAVAPLPVPAPANTPGS